MRILLIALALLVSACGKSPDILDPELAPYVDRFKAEGIKYGHPVTIFFDIQFGVPDPSNARVVGECSGNNGVIISAGFWEHAPDADKEQLMFHELGHCALFLSHVKTYSIMYPIMLNTFWYLHYRDALVKELFTGIREIY